MAKGQTCSVFHPYQFMDPACGVHAFGLKPPTPTSPTLPGPAPCARPRLDGTWRPAVNSIWWSPLHCRAVRGLQPVPGWWSADAHLRLGWSWPAGSRQSAVKPIYWSLESLNWVHPAQPEVCRGVTGPACVRCRSRAWIWDNRSLIRISQHWLQKRAPRAGGAFCPKRRHQPPAPMWSANRGRPPAWPPCSSGLQALTASNITAIVTVRMTAAASGVLRRELGGSHPGEHPQLAWRPGPEKPPAHPASFQ